MSKWYLYIVRCNNGSLYTGITIDVARRFAEHCGEGTLGAKYLKGRQPLELVFQAEIGDRALATKVEMKVKKLPKEQKEKLVATGDGLEDIIKQLKR